MCVPMSVLIDQTILPFIFFKKARLIQVVARDPPKMYQYLE